MHFELSDLRIFVAIAKAPSLTQGANNVFISPAAASTRIKNLENQMGCRLFYRHNKGLNLTPAGKKLLLHARKILQQAQELRHEFSDFASHTRGHIRLLANTSAVISFLPEILASFLTQYPAISVDLHESLTKDTIRAVREGDADFGIVSGEIDAPDLEFIHFCTDYLCIALPCNHPLAQFKEGVDFETALQYPQVSFHPGSTLQKYLNDHKERLGIYTHNRISVAGFYSFFQLIEAGVGIGIVPLSVVKRHSHRQISAIPLNHPSAKRERKMIVQQINAQSPMVQALIEHIHIQATQMI